MVTGSYFQFTDDKMEFFRLSSAKNMLPRLLLISHNDDMLFQMIPTENYEPGTYHGLSEFDLINSSQLTSFTMLDMYVDKVDPSNIEFFIQTEDGEKYVMIPYCV